MGRPKAPAIVDGALRVLAAALLASLVAAAWHDVSKAWDTWAYHMPFAARIAGIEGPTGYAFGPTNEARYAGFPLLAEALQGALWRLTGRPECASLVALASLPALALFLWRVWRVPPHATLLALVAIPLVQIHATQCYVDLPANACATLLLLCAYRAVASRKAPPPKHLALAAVFAALAANMKFQLVPIVLAASGVLFVCALRRDGARRARVLVFVVTAPLVFATPLKNVARHGNPVYPVEIHLLGRSLNHTETTYESSPWYLEHASRPRRFVTSLLEVGLPSLESPRRWSVDQWTPPDHPGKRMGGFFHVYVVVNVFALVLAAVTRRSRETFAALGVAVGAAALTSALPQSHELRYYLYVMLLLVSLNLVVWAGEGGHRSGARVASLVALAAIGVVAASTRGAYLYPSGESFASLVASKVDAHTIESAAPGAKICVAEDPWTFLYAPVFHPDRRYAVQEASSKEECALLLTTRGRR